MQCREKVPVLQPVHTSMYSVHTSTYQYVPSLSKTFWKYCFVNFDCGKWYYVCMTCMLWCSKAESVPQSMATLHDIFSVHTWYVPVHTCMYHFIQVHTENIPVHTCMYEIPWFGTTVWDSRCPNYASTVHSIRLALGAHWRPQRRRQLPGTQAWLQSKSQVKQGWIGNFHENKLTSMLSTPPCRDILYDAITASRKSHLIVVQVDQWFQCALLFWIDAHRQPLLLVSPELFLLL